MKTEPRGGAGRRKVRIPGVSPSGKIRGGAGRRATPEELIVLGARARAAARPPPGDALLARIAEQFRALAEPSRLRLMHLLFERPCTVGELAEASGLGFANASKHLALLHAAGFVARRKEGLTVVYALSEERVRALCDLMCRRVEERAAEEARVLRLGGPHRPAEDAAGG